MPHRCATCRHHTYINPRYEANGWRACEPPVAQWDSPRRAVTGMDSGTRCAVWAGREQERTMIVTRTCDLCGWNNDNNNGPCHHCGGQTEEVLVRGRYKTVVTKKPRIPMDGYYNPAVKDAG